MKRNISFFLFLFVANLIFGQERVYCTYQSKNGMGIHLTYDNLPLDEVHTPLTTEKFEFIEPFYLGTNTGNLAKKYFRFRQKGKMGILNAKGKIMIPADFDTIIRFSRWINENVERLPDFFVFKKQQQVWVKRISNLKDFFSESYDSVAYDNFTGDLKCFEKGRVKYFCNDGEQLFPDIEFETIFQVYSMANAWKYQKPLRMIAKEPGKPMRVYAENLTFKNNEDAYLHGFVYEIENNVTTWPVLASKNGKMGLLDEQGNVQIPFDYNSLIPLNVWDKNKRVNLMVTVINDKQGLIDFHNKIIFPAEYSDGSFTENSTYYDKGIFIVSKGASNFQAVLDVHGKEIIPLAEQTIKELTHNGNYEQQYFYVTRNNKVGVYNFEGNEIIPCAYYHIDDKNSVSWSAKKPNFITFDSKESYFEFSGK